MNNFKLAFDTAKTINRRQESTHWHSVYYRYLPFYVEYCKIELTLNPIRTSWLGAVAAEHTTQKDGKKETYYDTSGNSPLEVLERLEEHIKEWLGERVYAEENSTGENNGA